MLVLDDEGLMRWTMRERLTQAGYSVLEAESGAEALALARTRRIDLLLLDVHLPDIDGLDVLARLRSERITCPVILMSAYGTAELSERAATLGAGCCVAKPFDLDAMLALIRWKLGTI